MVVEEWTNIGQFIRRWFGGAVYLHTSLPPSLHRYLGFESYTLISDEIKLQHLIDQPGLIVILEGSRGFVSTWFSQLRLASVQERVLILTLSQRQRGSSFLPSLDFRWFRIRHTSLGGLLSGSWLLGIWCAHATSFDSTDALLRQCSISFGLQRRIQDIIGLTSHGRNVTPSSTDITQLPYHANAVHVSSLSGSWIVPCVFSSSGWTQRSLTLKEIGGFFDISELTISKISDSASNFHPHVLFSGTPGKICDVAITLLGLSFSTKNDDGPTPPSAVSLAMASGTPVGTPVGSSPKNDVGSTPPSSAVSSATASGTPVGTPVGSSPFGLYTPTDDDLSMYATDYIAAYGDKAAKNDDAAVAVELWNSFLFRHFLPGHAYDADRHGKALQVLREKWAMRFYIRSVTKSFFRYLQFTYGRRWWRVLSRFNKLQVIVKGTKGGASNLSSTDLKAFYLGQELSKDLEVGLEGLKRVIQGSWWGWDHGSTLFFWRWPEPFRKFARDGIPVFVEGKLPSYRVKQRVTKNKLHFAAVHKKISKVVQRKYIVQGYIKSVINFFDVPKGESDIRMVYDGTKSGLNASVWAPNFFLASIDSALGWISVDTWHADRDLGEMFLNYFLDTKLRPYSGVDVTKVFGSTKTDWRGWNRCFMGFTPSPYCAGRFYGWTIDIIHGNRFSPTNPFRWDHLLVNLPGQADYNPKFPRLAKMSGDELASELEVYVDDNRTMGSSEVNCQLASSRVAQITQYLGQQDAPRKCRPPSRIPGPWCGAFIASLHDSVWVYVSQEKWDKAKTFVTEALRLVSTSKKLSYKFVEKGRGFMVYFCRTYTAMVPFLKGFHLSLESWRDNRDVEGWKLPHRRVPGSSEDNAKVFKSEDGDLNADAAFLFGPSVDKASSSEETGTTHHPEYITPVPRLLNDLSVLSDFLSVDKPPWRFVRGGRAAYVQYGFGDASKAGFGTTFQLDDSSIWFRMGVWGSDEDSESSNFRELANLVESLELRASSSCEGLKSLEIFLFTDNSTAEAAFFKGSSSNKKLLSLVTRLRKLELHEGCILHFVHVAGTRMIEQGTDGLSRGDSSEGVMKGQAMLLHVPLHLSCMERQPTLKNWILSFVSPGSNQQSVEFLELPQWFERAHNIVGGSKNFDGVWMPSYKSGTFIWTPPPAAAKVAVEQLRRARLKHHDSTHVFLVPRLMTPEWKRQLFRVSDLFIELPFDEHWTKASQHEPLILAFVFPFLPNSPWQLKRSGAFLGMAGMLRRVWKVGEVSTGIVLSKFFSSTRKLETMPKSLVWKMLQNPKFFEISHPTSRE